VFCFSVLLSFGQTGKLDSSFGVNGIVQTNLLETDNNVSNTVLIQNNGKIVICGNNEPALSEGILLRYNTNGSLDSSFGHNGIIQSPDYDFKKAALQPDGKIIVDLDSINYAPGGAFTQELTRFNTNGSLDSSFGNNGILVLDTIGYFISLSINKSGKILLVSNSNGPVWHISRYLNSGKVDLGFNTSGFLNLSFENTRFSGVAKESNDQIVIALTNYDTDSTYITRFDSTGKQESTFNFLNGIGYSMQMAVQGDKVILGTNFCGDSLCGFICIRANADGSIDTSFNHTGFDTIYNQTDIYQITGQQPYLQLYSLAVDSNNNNIILSGIFGLDDFGIFLNFFTTIRLLPDGEPDISFGTGGEADLQIGESHDYPYSVAIQSDNKIVITGSSEVHIFQGGNHIATVRYNTDGTLDQSFGTNGIDTPLIYTPTVTQVTSMSSAGEGKIFIGVIGTTANGSFANEIIQYNQDGTIDSSFNHGEPLQSGLSGIPSIAIANDKILEVYPGIAQYDGDSIHIFRDNLDGSADNSFGNNGHNSVFINNNIEWLGTGGASETPMPLLIQSDGKMVIAGFTVSNPNNFIIAGLNADGTLDNSFGIQGISIVQVPTFVDKFSLIQQTDGKILVGAGQSEAANNYPFYLFRFNMNGLLDSSFGMNGLATKLIDTGNIRKEASFILLQPDGKIIQAGSLLFGDSTTEGIAIVRYNSNGNVDSTFGINGIVKTFIPKGYDYINAGALQPDGKILITGKALYEGGYGFYSTLVRYLPNGIIDSSFADNGIFKLTVPPVKYYDPGSQANAIILQSDKILIGGYNNYNSETDMYIARFINDLTLGIINFSSPNNSALVYPNPIHQSATLKYTLSTDENITINLFDINGRVVKTFIAYQNQTKGNYTEQLSFDSNIAAGNYFLVISNGKQKETVKIIKQ
jgi:uncharacterized delta-60 repeat protein